VTVKDGSNATASDSFVLTIANVNDAPILQAGGPLTLEEGGHQVLTLADLLPADVDDDERSLVFERVGGASAGRLERVDAPGVAVDRFSAGDLADGLIRYVHDGSESVSDRLELRVRDVSGALSDPVRLEIVITPVDDEAPRIVSSDGQARVVLDHSENSPWQRVMQASDADRPLSVLQWRIAGGADAARFEIDADSGELRLLGLLDREQPQDADRDNHYEVLIEVSDGRQAATQQLLLRITDVDEAPEIEIGLLQVDQGMRLRLDESLLRAQDVDSAADVLVYRVVAVENGRFMAAGGNSVLTTFSQADVAAGRVVFQHDENSLAARFSLVLSDGRNESGVMSIEIAVRERGFDAGSMPTEPPPDRMPASSALVVSGIEPADPMRERTQQAQASQEIVRAAVLRGLAAREGGGAGAAELVAGDLMAGWVDALRRFATLSASETQAARPGALRGEVGFSVDLMRLPDSDLLVLLDVVLDLAGFEATALIRPVSEGVGGTQTASGETARSAGTDEPENLLQREWQSGTVARTGAVVMSAGALFWAVRAGGLAASLAFASPVWWRLDPLPVLQAARRETAGAEAGRRGWRDTGVTGELAGLAEDLLDRQG
nr:cadherin domain-containing protein [Sphaerotilus sp.]